MKPFNQIINKSGTLDQITRSARHLELLTRQFRGAVSSDAAPHIVGCALRSDAVLIFCDTAAWASQLRYLQQTLLEHARKLLGNRIQRIQFRILPSESPAGKPPAPEITENSRRILDQAASGISDNDLAEALQRLALADRDDDQDVD